MFSTMMHDNSPVISGRIISGYTGKFIVLDLLFAVYIFGLLQLFMITYKAQQKTTHHTILLEGGTS